MSKIEVKKAGKRAGIGKTPAPDPVIEDLKKEGSAKEALKEAPKPKPIKEYFEVIGSKNRRFVLPSGNIVDLRFGVPANCLEFYIQGKGWLGLKDGAEILFRNYPDGYIEKLIRQAPRPEDARILKKALKK